MERTRLKDIAIATGATVFNEEASLIKIEDVHAEDFGEADEVTITKDDTLILRGKGTPAEIEKRITQIIEEIELSTSDYEKVDTYSFSLVCIITVNSPLQLITVTICRLVSNYYLPPAYREIVVRYHNIIALCKLIGLFL